MTETLHIQLLGDFHLRYGDTPVETLRSPRLQSLLAYLVLHRDAPQSRHHLAFLLWPDSTEADARAQLRRLLHRLRQALPDADTFLHADTQTVRWVLDAPFALDVAEFQNAVAGEGQAEEPGVAREAMERAVALYRGDLLPSCYDDWIQPRREQLRQVVIETLERLILLLEEGRDYREAIGYAQRLLRQDSLHEPAYRRLMRLHAFDGNRSGALRVYHTCATVLERELGVEPGPATVKAYERLLRAEVLPEPLPTSTVAPGTLSAHVTLVGRQGEWAQLRAAWRRAAAGGAHLALVAGEAGIGKTRLAEELTRWVGQQGMAALAARCYAAEGKLAYAPVVDWLRARPLPPLEPAWLGELARLLPELLVERPDLAPPGPMNEAWQRRRLFEALARAVLGGSQPLLLVVDDVQWCDRGTLEWLHYLLRYDRRARLLVVGTVRPEELGDDHPLLPWLQALRRDGQLAEIELAPLDEEETLALAANVAGRALDPELAARVYRETEGNPLFVVEMVRAGLPLGEGGPARLPGSLPRLIRGAIEARLAQLSPPARELARLAATVGREFSLPVLARAGDLDQDGLVRAVDELWQRRIVREQGAEGYDFGHDKIREVVYGGLSAARRRLLHRRVARAMEEVYAGDPDAVSAQVAAHHERGGQPGQAVPHYLRAGEVAGRIYANEEARAYYERALALLDALSAGGAKSSAAGQGWRLAALGGLGEVLFRLADHDGAEECFREAISFGRKAGQAPRKLARLYHGLGRILGSRRHSREQVRLAQEGLALLGNDVDSVEAALMLGQITLGYHRAGDQVRARAYMDRTANLLERLPYVGELAEIYKHIVAVYRRVKDVERAARWRCALERGAASHGDVRGLEFAHSHAAMILFEQGDLRGAIPRRRQALDVSARTGQVGGKNFHLFRLGLAFLSLGDLPKAEEYVRKVIEVARNTESKRDVAPGCNILGEVLLCRGALEDAVDALETALSLARERGRYEIKVVANRLLGRTYLRRGDRAGALGRFQRAAALLGPEAPRHWQTITRPYLLTLAGVLDGLEGAYGGEAFRDFCRRYREQVPDVNRPPGWGRSVMVQWFLEPVAPHDLPRKLLREDWTRSSSLPPPWEWHDPFGDCRFALRDGLEIHAANGRDLWRINLSAPRLLRSASASPGPNWAVQTACTPVADDVPAMGGLLLWADKENYLRVDRGSRGRHGIAFMGCLENRDVVIGRGRLPSERVHLRLERTGERVRALCSADGERWFTVGEVAFPAAGPLQVGLYAIGNIDRAIYHGAYAEGAAIRFESFQLWG